MLHLTGDIDIEVLNDCAMYHFEEPITENFVNAWEDDSLYQKWHKASVENVNQFWSTQTDCIYWQSLPTDVYDNGYWLINGRSNLYYNCVARHATQTPDKVAFINYYDDPSMRKTITYCELDILVKKVVRI